MSIPSVDLSNKIYYKFSKEIPAHLRSELLLAAQVSHELDRRMQSLHRSVHGDPGATPA